MTTRLLIILLLACSSSLLAAQTSHDWTDLNKKLNARNQGFHKMLLPDFSAIGTDGSVVNNNTVKGKVTLIVFWYPSCNCFNFAQLDPVIAAFKNNPMVNIIAMGGDSSNWSRFIAEKYFPLKYYRMRDHETVGKFSGGNGFASFMIINKQNEIEKIWVERGGINADNWIDKIKSLLM